LNTNTDTVTQPTLPAPPTEDVIEEKQNENDEEPAEENGEE
jgi:hypothetical protein